MYGNKKISCVVPCYNEKAGLEIMLRYKPWFIDEIIVVDNDSCDGTADVAHRYNAVVVYEKRRGYGYAYQAGLPEASGDIIIAIDGDCSYPLGETEKLLVYMEKNNLDFVVGCRYPLAHKNAQPTLNKIANYSIAWLIRALFRINLMDAESGMMVFNQNILSEIIIRNTGMSFSPGIKINAFLNQNIKCGETHIFYLPRVGKSKFRRIIDSLQTFYFVLSMWVKGMLLKKK